MSAPPPQSDPVLAFLFIGIGFAIVGGVLLAVVDSDAGLMLGIALAAVGGLGAQIGVIGLGVKLGMQAHSRAK